MTETSNSSAGETPGKGKAGAPAEPTPEFTLMLDRSRPFGEVLGDAPYGFEQDGLTFDKGGRLMLSVMTDPKERRKAEEIVRRKLARLKAVHVEAVKAPVGDTKNPDGPTAPRVEEDPDADINLGLWAKGELALMPHVVYKTMRKRYSKHFHSLKEVREYLVKEKVVDVNELAA